MIVKHDVYTLYIIAQLVPKLVHSAAKAVRGVHRPINYEPSVMYGWWTKIDWKWVP